MKYRINYNIDFTCEPKFDFTIEQIEVTRDASGWFILPNGHKIHPLDLFDTEELAAKEVSRKIQWETSWAEQTIKNLAAQNKAREAAQRKLTSLYPGLL
jgi:hypothetical protein